MAADIAVSRDIRKKRDLGIQDVEKNRLAGKDLVLNSSQLGS
jgi:hypothetical protein